MIKILPVKLTDEEMRAKAYELARVVADLTSLEREKAEKSREIGGKIDQARKDMSRLSQQISNKQEYRDVLCEEQFDFDQNIVKLVRKDTFDVVETRFIYIRATLKKDDVAESN